MKKLILIAVLFTIVISCSKKNDPQPQAAGGTTTTPWPGLYCATFFNTINGKTDTLGKMCLNDAEFASYSTKPNPFGGNGYVGKKIWNCSVCK